ncbi:MAG: CHC2 zinc finger domain-containing protein, partial [Bacteroidales bacterium]|nr:CHC2 zinc finger domain-containing protein [Bacteroidales bacterium]
MTNIDTIKGIDIKTVISKETNLNFRKNTLEYCPFCQSGNHGKGSTSAFSVHPGKNIFHCFSCEKKGGVIEFVRQYKGLENGEAIKYLANNFGNIPAYVLEKKPKTDLEKKIFAINNNNKTKAEKYLNDRGINTNKLPANSFSYDRYTDAVVFIDDKRQLINKRFIAPEQGQPKAIFEKGSIIKNALYTRLYDDNKETVYIVEGVINSLSLTGYSSIAIFTSSNSADDVGIFAKFLQNKNVVLAFDNDEAGKKCSEYYQEFIINQINVKSLSVLLLPEHKDINDLLKEKKLSKFLKDTDNYEYIKADLLNIPLKKNDRSISEHFFIKYSCYYITEQRRGYQIEIDISDCIFEFLYRLTDNEGTRLIKIQQTQIKGENRIKLLELTSEQLKKDKFEVELSKHGFSFYGKKYHLDRIRTHLQHQEKTANAIQTFGHQLESNIFAFSNCIITEDNKVLYPNSLGMIEDKGTTYYLPTASLANQLKFAELKSFSYKEGNINFSDFAKLFVSAYPIGGSVGIQFYLLALFRDVVFSSLDFFPYLYLYGEAGGGKTSFVDLLLGLFGDASKGYGLKNISQAGLSRIAAQKRNTMTYYKEYSKEVPGYVEDYLKTGYDGQSRTISAKSVSKETISFNVESAGIIDSNFLPTNETAVFTRMVILDFEDTNFTEMQTKAYEDLKEQEKQGLAQITKEVLNHRAFFVDNFKDVYFSTLDYLKKRKQLKQKFTHERTIKHIALFLTPYFILSEKLKFPFNSESLEDTIIVHAEAQEEKLHAFKSTNIFWQGLETAKKEHKFVEFNGHNLSQAHYYKKMLTANTGEIYIKTKHLNYAISLYAKYCKSIGLDNKTIDSYTELKSKLLSKGYEPFQQPEDNSKKRKGCNIHLFGYSYKFLFSLEKNKEG